MTVRAKFYVWAKTEFSGRDSYVRVEMLPVSGDDPENKLFWDATPSGKIEMVIKPDVAVEFEVGHAYYIDFSPETKAMVE